MLILESLLGVQLSGDLMSFNPCIPMIWGSYQIEYRYRSTMYHIGVHNAGTGIKSVVVDGIVQADNTVHLVDDEGEHRVMVELGV